jgi:hypothetical protein
MAQAKKIVIATHWLHQLTQVRCWLDGFNTAMSRPGYVEHTVPGQDVLRQIINEINAAK